MPDYKLSVTRTLLKIQTALSIQGLNVGEIWLRTTPLQEVLETLQSVGIDFQITIDSKEQ